MLEQSFIDELNDKYGFDINSINLTVTNLDDEIVLQETLYQKSNASNDTISYAYNAGILFVAIRLLKNKVDPVFIAKVTNLSLEEIKKLKEEIG